MNNPIIPQTASVNSPSIDNQRALSLSMNHSVNIAKDNDTTVVFVSNFDMLNRIKELDGELNKYRGQVFGKDWVKEKPSKYQTDELTLQLKALQSFEIPVVLKAIPNPEKDIVEALIVPEDGYKISYYEDASRLGMVYQFKRIDNAS